MSVSFNQARKTWHGIISFTSIASVLVIPLSLIYPILSRPQAILFGVLISVFYGCDIVIEFRTPFLLTGELVVDRKRIASRYIRHGFLVDVLAALPFFLLVSVVRFPESPYLPLLGLLHLVKLIKANKLLKVMAEDKINPAILRLALLIFWIFMAAHLISCAWIMVSGNPDALAPSDRYILALYWTVTTITTIGYGDITPRGTDQILFVIMVQIFGAAMYGLVIGNIAGLLANIDVAKTQYKEKLEKLNAFFKYRNIPADLKHKIDSYYMYLWETRRGYNEISILEDLPGALKEQVALNLNREIIEKVPLFEKADPHLVRDIVINLKPAVFTPGDYIMRAGEYGDEMYFISRGSVDILSADEKTKYATLGAGSFFGEMALLLSSARTATVVAATYCDLYVLDKITFDRIIGRYEQFQKSIRQMAEKRRLEIEASQKK